MLSEMPCRALQASSLDTRSSLKTVKEILRFLRCRVALLVSSCFCVWGTVMGFWKVPRAVVDVQGPEGCRRGRGPQSHWALIHSPASPFCWGWVDCSNASGPPRGALFTHRPGHFQCFCLSSPRRRWLWACWRSRKCVFATRWTVPMW